MRSGVRYPPEASLPCRRRRKQEPPLGFWSCTTRASSPRGRRSCTTTNHFVDIAESRSTVAERQHMRVLRERVLRGAVVRSAGSRGAARLQRLPESGSRACANRRGPKISGGDDKGEGRVMEAHGLRFFGGALFLPQTHSREAMPHPLTTQLLRSARERSGGLLFSAAERAATTCGVWASGP